MINAEPEGKTIACNILIINPVNSITASERSFNV